MYPVKTAHPSKSDNFEVSFAYTVAPIRELFSAFDNDNVAGLNIPKFDSVERKQIEGEEIDVYCKVSKETWIAEITKENIGLNEIENIKRKADKISKIEKLKEVIVISIKEIKLEAVEQCKKYNFRVWTLEDINKLIKKKKMFRILI